MKSYKFTTYITEQGTIILPEDQAHQRMGKKVEVIISDIIEPDKDKMDLKNSDFEDDNPASKKTDAINFIRRWQGVIKGKKIDDDRYTYLMNKYK